MRISSPSRLPSPSVSGLRGFDPPLHLIAICQPISVRIGHERICPGTEHFLSVQQPIPVGVGIVGICPVLRLTLVGQAISIGILLPGKGGSRLVGHDRLGGTNHLGRTSYSSLRGAVALEPDPKEGERGSKTHPQTQDQEDRQYPDRDQPMSVDLTGQGADSF